MNPFDFLWRQWLPHVTVPSAWEQLGHVVALGEDLPFYLFLYKIALGLLMGGVLCWLYAVIGYWLFGIGLAALEWGTFEVFGQESPITQGLIAVFKFYGFTGLSMACIELVLVCITRR